MIKATVQEAVEAFGALSSIGEREIPAKAAYRVARLIGKLKSEARAFDEARRKALRAAGARDVGGSLRLEPPIKGKDQSETDYHTAVLAHQERMAAVAAELEEIGRTAIEIDYDPIPLSLFNGGKDGEARLRPIDLANAGPFIVDVGS